MNTNEDLLVGSSGGTLRITLNRPDKGNRLTTGMLNRIQGELRCVGYPESDISCVVLGAGGDDFCLGGDLGKYTQMDSWEIRRFADALVDGLLAIRDCKVPVIVCLNGRVEGGGLSVAEACDIAIAARGSTFAIPEIIAGLPPVVSFSSCSRAFSTKALMRMAISGVGVDAEEALANGLITEIAQDAEDLNSRVARWIREIESKGPSAIRTVKELRATVDCGRYKRQLDEAKSLLIQTLTSREARQRKV